MPKQNSPKKSKENDLSKGKIPKPFPIVGIGASAGGLEAFTKLITRLPIDTGMAFVLLQHLDPKHESMSASILSRATSLPVLEVKEATVLMPNSIYVLTPGFDMGILHGALHLIPRSDHRNQKMVIDFFFQSLSEDQKNRAIGIVLSGTGSDGTLGLRAIKANGGITFAQTPASAKFDGMPQSAIASGMADLTLSPEEIADELVRIASHPYVARVLSAALDSDIVLENSDDNKNSLNQIFLLIRNLCHTDFSFYKANTVGRRIERRMALQKMADLKGYSNFLAENADEVQALYADILIHVTDFFRDPEAFDALKTDVFPKLVANRAPGAPIRIWIAGCSTGEEVYSMAISLIEFLGADASHTPIQIFATDVSNSAIQKARVGEYPETIINSVSKERLGRFFTRLDDGRYKIVKSIRDICLFSRHDVTKDPPFAKIDLISCRNLLIYFTPTLQKHVIPIFHYSLSPGGFLWLGMSETIGAFSEHFAIVSKTNKTYVRNHAPLALSLHFPPNTYVQATKTAIEERKASLTPAPDIQKIAEQAIETEYPRVLVNAEMEILLLLGRTAPFIEPPSGLPTFNLLKMAHPDLVRDLRINVQAAFKSGLPVYRSGLSLGDGALRKEFNLNIVPVKSSSVKSPLCLIVFEKFVAQIEPSKVDVSASSKVELDVKNHPYVVELQNELKRVLDYQEALNEKFESSQEDLTSLNEELQSANEEMQSTNEELETAKEELQSNNEELTTVNDELQTRSLEQVQTNNDLVNLLGSIEIPIVMLSWDRKVRRFTPLAGKGLNLIPSDVGRPLSDLKLNFRMASGEIDLEQMVSDAIDSLVSQEVEVQDNKGRWYRLQVRPYKTLDNRIDGAVLAFVDIDTLKLSLQRVKESRAEAEQANRAKDLFLATLSHELRTPLSAMLSWAEMLASGTLDADRMNKGAKIIEASAKTQAQLINDLLDVSRIVSGKLSLDSFELDPRAVVVNAIESVRAVADLKSVKIDSSLETEVGTVIADPNRLQQVLWNLLSNAVKFSVPGSKITVGLDRVKDARGISCVAIRVKDTGKGIAPEFLPKIFERFTQQDDSSVRIHGGLGLGLAIVLNLVELQGGTVHAESLGDQMGSTFTVMLPIHSNDLSSLALSTRASILKSGNGSDEPSPVRLDGVRALIVDDEVNTRDAFGEVLRSFGADTHQAGSAKEGLQMMTQFKPNILLSDIAMPGEDGYSLIQKIRNLSPEDGGNIPALAITAYAGVDDVRRALAAGFQAHLSKPVDGRDLAHAIAKLTRGQ